MKFTMKWGGKARHKKTVKPEPKIRWKLLGLADPAQEKVPMPIDEVRRQVLMMSSPGLDSRDTAPVDSMPTPSSHPTVPAKRARRPRRKAK